MAALDAVSILKMLHWARRRWELNYDTWTILTVISHLDAHLPKLCSFAKAVGGDTDDKMKEDSEIDVIVGSLNTTRSVLQP